MSKTTAFTTITPIPNGVSRETVMSTLRDHVEMIDLNPLVIERNPCKAPSFATAEEYHAIWYEITDRVSYLPGGLAKGKVTYHGCFNDLAEGLQTHIYAPLGLDIRSRWLLGGNLPGEPSAPVELGLGIPRQGLYLREDVSMRCNVLMGSFVRKNLKNSHATLVDRLLEKAKITEVGKSQASLGHVSQYDPYRQSMAPASSPSLHNSSPAMTHMSLGNDRMSMLSNDGSFHQPPQYNKPLPSLHGHGTSPGLGVDPAYSAANPYGAHTPPPGQPSGGYMGQHPYPSHPQALASQGAGQGPPQHQSIPGYVELPSEQKKQGGSAVELPG